MGTSGKPKKALPDIEISRKQSAEWQRAAKVPEEKFEAAIATVKEIGELTAAAVRRALNTAPPKPPKELDADERYSRLHAAAISIYGKLPPKQRSSEITEHAKWLVEDMGNLPEYISAPPAAVIIPDSAEYSGPPKVVLQTAELKRALARLTPENPYDYVKLFAVDSVVKLTAGGPWSTLTVGLPGARAYGAVTAALFPLGRLRAIVKAITEETMVIQGRTLLAGDFRTEVETRPAFSAGIELNADTAFAAAADVPPFATAEIDLAVLQRQLWRVSFAIPKKNICAG